MERRKFLILIISSISHVSALYLSSEKLFSPSVYTTIAEGRIAVVPNFLSQEEVDSLLRDAAGLYQNKKFSTDALASYGQKGKFDPSKDRAVLKLQQWKDQGIGDWNVRQRFGNGIKNLRQDLSYNLNRPGLLVGDSVSRYGEGSTEISYARFGPGAFLNRHVDEHHEELKGKAGWSKPTRRSLTWLVYLNENWDANKHGGCLRCFERKASPSGVTGARGSGDLQIGWLNSDGYSNEIPVFMDAQHVGTGANSGLCALYVDDPADKTGRKYISKSFHSHPTLYMGGAEIFMKGTLMTDKTLAQRFKLIEPPKSTITDFLDSKQRMAEDERILDVEPQGGTLVLFDSVTLPHEVLATTTRERWAASGWMHEDQQPVETHPHFNDISLSA